jgi:hypothetical protein
MAPLLGKRLFLERPLLNLIIEPAKHAAALDIAATDQKPCGLVITHIRIGTKLFKRLLAPCALLRLPIDFREFAEAEV